MGAAGGARAATPRAKAGPIAVWEKPARLFGSRAPNHEPFAPRPSCAPQTTQPQRSSATPRQLDACAGWPTLCELGREGYTRMIFTSRTASQSASSGRKVAWRLGEPDHWRAPPLHHTARTSTGRHQHDSRSLETGC
eukprot:scaffold100277_cov30-Tisochrysis_lutea.AAC.5